MTARVVTVAAAKGGVGKSTITLSLAAIGAGAGEKIAIVDAEPQQSVGLWWERRGQPGNPSLHSVDNDRDLNRTVGRLKAGESEWVLIDTPPAMLERIEAAVSLADFVLIPARASMFDVEAISPIVELCKDYGKPFAFVMSHAAARSALLAGVIEALQDFGPVLDEQVRFHEVYAAALTAGKTAPEMKGKAAADARAEIGDLWKAVKRRAGGKPAGKAR